MIYITYTDQELKDELAAAKAEYQSVITKWQAGDTTVEKAKSSLDTRIARITAEIRLRPTMADMVRRERCSTSVASFR